ncbi:MAG: peptide chain release factor N(5)-glutamine methyltransferase [bacterium]
MATPSTPAPRTVGEFVAAGTAYLERQRVENPRVVCELLACRLFHCPRLQLFLHYAETPPPPIVDAWRRGLKRVADGEPLQYVLGEWDFRRLTLTVDPRALIPRPETEQLVDLVLAATELWSQTANDGRSGRSAGSRDAGPALPTTHAKSALPLIVDVGTGTGCIVLSLATERPQARYIAIDASAAALELALTNASRCGVADAIEFRHANGGGEFPAGSVDAMVANLPYIPTPVVATLEKQIRDHEPRQALDGGPDGLDIIRDVTRDAVMVLRPRGWLFLEIGDEQGSAVRELLESLGFVDVAILPDLAGQTRFARARQGG